MSLEIGGRGHPTDCPSDRPEQQTCDKCENHFTPLFPSQDGDTCPDEDDRNWRAAVGRSAHYEPFLRALLDWLPSEPEAWTKTARVIW